MLLSFQAGDDSAEMHQRLKDLGVPIPTGPDAVPSLPSAPVPLGNIIPAPTGPMGGMGQPYPLLPQIPVGPTEFLSVNGMVTAEVLADDEEYKEVGLPQLDTQQIPAYASKAEMVIGNKDHQAHSAVRGRMKILKGSPHPPPGSYCHSVHTISGM